VIFSNEAVAAALTDFECAWESVRPVPRVEIDFGNGHKLSRTLNGNIATTFCDPEGQVIDLLPGLVTAEEFLGRAGIAATLHGRLAETRSKAELLRSYHRLMAESVAGGAEGIRRAGEAAVRRFDLSKARVEDGLKESLRAMVDAQVSLAGADAKVGTKELREDTAYNRANRYPKAHALLARQADRVAPSALTKTVYKEILDVDLDDPYLGLAPYVLGGEGGRK
jgi:hypothetical protein